MRVSLAANNARISQALIRASSLTCLGASPCDSQARHGPARLRITVAVAVPVAAVTTV
jgi:hypothetical protein